MAVKVRLEEDRKLEKPHHVMSPYIDAGGEKEAYNNAGKKPDGYPLQGVYPPENQGD